MCLVCFMHIFASLLRYDSSMEYRDKRIGQGKLFPLPDPLAITDRLFAYLHICIFAGQFAGQFAWPICVANLRGLIIYAAEKYGIISVKAGSCTRRQKSLSIWTIALRQMRLA